MSKQIILIGSPTCSPCKSQKKLFDTWENKPFTLHYVDGTLRQKELKIGNWTYSIETKAVPCLVFIGYDGNVFLRKWGFTSAEEIVDILKTYDKTER